MTLFPGDTVGGRYTVTRLVAYQGKDGCASWQCTRRGAQQLPDGTWDRGQCFGWHCALCDAPCSSQGHHNCPRAGDVQNERHENDAAG